MRPVRCLHALNDQPLTFAGAETDHSELSILHPGYPPGCLEGIVQQVTQVMKFKLLPAFLLCIEPADLSGRRPYHNVLREVHQVGSPMRQTHYVKIVVHIE